MLKLERIISRIAVLPLDNVNTDQIIPARFLTRTGAGSWDEGLFAEWKNQADFPLKASLHRGSSILLAGSNFGCGSSREHAVWALRDAGFRVIVAPSFADIFYENAVKNGLLPAIVTADGYKKLLQAVNAVPDQEWAVDLTTNSIHSGDTLVLAFSVNPFAKHCLLHGLDELGFILESEIAINDFEVRAGFV